MCFIHAGSPPGQEACGRLRSTGQTATRHPSSILLMLSQQKHGCAPTRFGSLQSGTYGDDFEILPAPVIGTINSTHFIRQSGEPPTGKSHAPVSPGRLQNTRALRGGDTARGSDMRKPPQNTATGLGKAPSRSRDCHKFHNSNWQRNCNNN